MKHALTQAKLSKISAYADTIYSFTDKLTPTPKADIDHFHGVAMFSIARGAISSPSMPGSLPVAPKLMRNCSHFLAGPCGNQPTYRSMLMYRFASEKGNHFIVIVAHLPGEVLFHAVLNHLGEGRSTVDINGPFHSFHNFFYVLLVNDIALRRHIRNRCLIEWCPMH